MKKNGFFGLIITILIGLLMLFFSGCDGNEPLGVNSAAAEFNIALFEQNIVDRIGGLNPGNRPIGWAYVINKDGQYFSGDGFGKARTDADPPASDFTENKPINVASITKFFTAIAVMQLLDQRDLSINSPIAPWLPPSFIQGAGPGVVSGINPGLTFKDLLTHQSGLQSSNLNFPATLCFTCMDNVMATGVVGNKSNRNYLNVNFALFRTIIPALWKGLPGGPPANESLTDATTQQRYIQYMQEKVFTPAGVSADCIGESASEATIYYNVADANATGARYGDWTPLAAGGGYYLSAVEVAKVLAHFEHSEGLLSTEMKTIMKENRIGFDLANEERERHGDYFGKNGSISDNNNKGVLCQTLSFPINDVEIVVVMNTQGVIFPNNYTLSDVMHRAYNDAWIDPKSK